MADQEGGGAESITTWTSKIDAAPSIQVCVELMTKLSTMMRTDAQLSGPLETAAIMWNSSADAVNTARLELRSVTDTLLHDWHSEDSKDFVAARTITETSLETSYNGMAPVQGVLNTLAGQIRTTAATVETKVDELNKLVETYNSSQPIRQSAAQFEAGWAKKARVPLRAAGDAMIGLAEKFSVAGSFLTEDAAKLKWDGPGSRNGAPTSSTPSSTPSAPSSPGGPTGADPAATDPGGQQAGPADQGGGAQEAGAGAGEGAGGMDGAGGSGAGSVPGVPGGGTGLAGMPAASTMVPRFEGSLPNVPSVPTTQTPGVPPMSTLPVGAVPGGALGGRGVGKVPGGGGVGGGGLPGVPGGGGVGQKGGVDSQLPRAVPETGSSQGPLSGGRAPGAPSGLAGGTGAAGAGAGGGMPPMMPPMGGAAGAGSSKAGRPGNGVIAPGNRRRDRQQGDTPGVPVGLRGRAGKDLPGAFPAVPVNTRRRKEKTEAANTLQLLDEDLWKVEATDTKAAPPATRQERRPSN
ncbi:hypothetical protein [Kribbella speibonae]|uniref:PPE domain-containing protein n=1 Tax=Kribbella speibonae TaxID=1572660 RepID=A0A4R0ITE4_9ACTN|nr:hypothetical protein [Kribbella speibonae]TCC31985.1 hypothetical protein E0H92_36365 [Kribbella speibonae]